MIHVIFSQAKSEVSDVQQRKEHKLILNSRIIAEVSAIDSNWHTHTVIHTHICTNPD